jgi:endonuclease-3
MAVVEKQRIVSKILAQMARLSGMPIPGELGVLDHLLIGVLQQDASFSRAFEAYRRLRRQFPDLNELRVSHPKEVAELLDGVPDRETKSKRILQILQFVFETTYLFDLESMRRKPLKQAQKQLSKITGTNDFAVSATVQRSLGGHAIPIDGSSFDLLSRIGLIPADIPVDQARMALEHIVPKSKGVDFALFLGELSDNPEKRRRFLDAVCPRSERSAGSKSQPRERANTDGVRSRHAKTTSRHAPAKRSGKDKN